MFKRYHGNKNQMRLLRIDFYANEIIKKHLLLFLKGSFEMMRWMIITYTFLQYDILQR